jgi:hypothetical protein
MGQSNKLAMPATNPLAIASGIAMGAAAATPTTASVPAAAAPNAAPAPVATAVLPTLVSLLPVIFFEASFPATPKPNACITMIISLLFNITEESKTINTVQTHI